MLNKERLAALTDAIVAIAATIMDLKRGARGLFLSDLRYHLEL
jgi:hypothetical protein